MLSSSSIMMISVDTGLDLDSVESFERDVFESGSVLLVALLSSFGPLVRSRNMWYTDGLRAITSQFGMRGMASGLHKQVTYIDIWR